MRLYEAMLRGARKGPQVFGTWADGNGGTCAMGAVMSGCDCPVNQAEWYASLLKVKALFPELLTQAKCPVEGCFRTHHDMSLMDTIMHVNDFHLWSRQRIAEWLSGSKVTPAKAKEVVGA